MKIDKSPNEEENITKITNRTRKRRCKKGMGAQAERTGKGKASIAREEGEKEKAKWRPQLPKTLHSHLTSASHLKAPPCSQEAATQQNIFPEIFGPVHVLGDSSPSLWKGRTILLGPLAWHFKGLCHLL